MSNEGIDQMVGIISKNLFEQFVEFRIEQTAYPRVSLPISEIDGVRISYSSIIISPNDIQLYICPTNHGELNDDEESVFKNLLPTYENFVLSAFTLIQKSSVYKPVVTKPSDLISFSLFGIESAIRAIMVTLDRLRYDVMVGRFTTDPIADDTVHKALGKFVSRGKCKSKLEECCVCYEATKTKTNGCKHSMCGKCISQMCEEKTDCPMCRAELWNNEAEKEYEE